MYVFIILYLSNLDINECAEATDDLCTAEDTVCHNTPGAFKCVSLKKRDVGLSCPPGFKRNLINQVCDGKCLESLTVKGLNQQSMKFHYFNIWP